MFKAHQECIRNNTDEYFQQLSEDELKKRLEEPGEYCAHQPKEEMRKKLKKIERTRHLIVWLDNSTVANHGYLVCLVTCLYDPTVFYTGTKGLFTLHEKSGTDRIESGTDRINVLV